MYNIIRLLVKYHRFIFFVVLELLCLWIITLKNPYHHSAFVSSSNSIFGGLNSTRTMVSDFWGMKGENTMLMKENSRLMSMKRENFFKVYGDQVFINDTLYKQRYVYRDARIVNNWVRRKQNFITLDKGEKNGIRKGMAVITHKGVVGQVKEVSDHFALVTSLLNMDLYVPVQLRKNGSFGVANWDGMDYRKTILNDVPVTVMVNVGDTIETSGFSSVYPSKIPLGTVGKVVTPANSPTHVIEVDLLEDFLELRKVFVVKNIFKEEQEELERSIE